MSSVQPGTFHTLQHSMYYYITTQRDRSYMTPLVYIGYLLKVSCNPFGESVLSFPLSSIE